MANISVGDKAPDFVAVTTSGSNVSLNDFLGDKALVLFFYPRDNSPICTKEACSFRDSYEQFVQAGAEVIGVSSDSTNSHQEFAEQYQLSFPLISDSDGKLRKQFGVPATLGLLPGRVTYVIDRDGIVRLIFSAQFASEEHVRKALQAVETHS
ncbi:MAG: peroxiredoxin [Planctomycetaceae bacterium]|nr:peroxiredoxin [Planctomycetaceae bacterium]